MDKLNWEETYKQFTRDTAQYPKEVEMEYLMIGLANEVGEVLGKFKKHIRGDTMVLQDFHKALIKELGDVMWYLTRICDVLNVSLYEVMTQNVSKLITRKANNTIKGDGDDR
jgi:NTP pyrophosphatase (non-canonical NTP hydrolase)